MISRIDELALELPVPRNPSPNVAAAVQALLGAECGEMSTPMTCRFQSFDRRGRKQARPPVGFVPLDPAAEPPLAAPRVRTSTRRCSRTSPTRRLARR